MHIYNENMSSGKAPASPDIISIQSKASHVHLGSLDSFDITEGGIKAAGKILDYLENGSEEALFSAIDIYNRLIPKENFGGEYTALLWISKFFIASEKEKMDFLSHPIVESFYELFSKDDFANLKEYLKRKYHYIETAKDDPTAKLKLRYLEDFILFNNPDRERWDKTSAYLERLNLREGDHIADVGSGSGYFTFKFAEMVGEKGHVYAIETNERHLNFLRNYIDKYDINNVDIVKSCSFGIGLDSSTKVDLVYMCSLYHNIYASFTEGERDLFIENIKASMKKNARFVIVDNDLVEGDILPYHGPYISRDLIISQLKFYGFKLLDQYQYSPQRYVLEFGLSSESLPVSDALLTISELSLPLPELSLPVSDESAQPLGTYAADASLQESDTSIQLLNASVNKSDGTVHTPAMFVDEKSADLIKVTSKQSLVRYRMTGISSPGYTLAGKKVARLFHTALYKKDKAAVTAALNAYEELMPKERIGDEYSAFLWFCQYLLAKHDHKKQMLKDSFDAEYFHRLADDDFAFLKKYVRLKYDLAKPDPEEPDTDDDSASKRIHEVVYEYIGDEVSFDELNDWSEFITFNNPNRESWDKTGSLMDYLKIKAGEIIADVGCGTGYYSFKFSKLAGASGKVYASEVNKDALSYVEKMSKKYGLDIQIVQAALNNACLPEKSIDTIFMCSMYHAVYITSIEFVKDQFIASLKKALKKDGRLVIVDNTIETSDFVPYFGPGIAKELIIAQLKHYGFRLVDTQQFIQQRYVLVFLQDENHDKNYYDNENDYGNNDGNGHERGAL